MKKWIYSRSLFVTVFVFAANLTVFASNPETELIYNTEEIDGVKMSETVYKMNEGILTNFEKYNYKYNDKKQVVENVLQKWDEGRGTWRNHMCIKYTYNENSTTIQYYKWNKNKERLHSRSGNDCNYGHVKTTYKKTIFS